MRKNQRGGNPEKIKQLQQLAADLHENALISNFRRTNLEMAVFEKFPDATPEQQEVLFQLVNIIGSLIKIDERYSNIEYAIELLEKNKKNDEDIAKRLGYLGYK